MQEEFKPAEIQEQVTPLIEHKLPETQSKDDCDTEAFKIKSILKTTQNNVKSDEDRNPSEQNEFPQPAPAKKISQSKAVQVKPRPTRHSGLQIGKNIVNLSYNIKLILLFLFLFLHSFTASPKRSVNNTPQKPNLLGCTQS